MFEKTKRFSIYFRVGKKHSSISPSSSEEDHQEEEWGSG